MQLTTDFFQQTSKVFTVSELTRSIRGTLETKFAAVWVQGEMSNYKLHPSGHQYFTLKDQRAQISCVIWRDTMQPPRQPLADGAQVQVFGTVTVFEARGQYQLNVQIIQPRGVGVLQAKFEALKRKLEAEGLFAPERKRPLPKFPRRIGIVTSPIGAAVRDMLNVLRRRAPWLQILINPVRVQGTGAAQEIAVAIREFALPNEGFRPVDLIVVTRGGGSIEDLWEFNEEIVSRAIFHSAVPIVSAVGHEIDFTICDFVADLRAPTPSAAAELIVPDVVDLQRQIDRCARTLARQLLNRVRDAQQRLDHARETLRRCLAHRIESYKSGLLNIIRALQPRKLSGELMMRRNHFADLHRRLVACPARLLENAKHRFSRIQGILRVLGPDATLRRGYSITMDDHGHIVRTTAVVRPKMKIRTRVSDGEFGSEVS
ncbi:MAG TPA: exodeoxyribonuclease VII large subunit [Candidatus Udaeobacter sp.]|nr:exodeoxyribonuclease VII large subunit [Candidatus Udaeobacter sp.]